MNLPIHSMHPLSLEHKGIPLQLGKIPLVCSVGNNGGNAIIRGDEDAAVQAVMEEVTVLGLGQLGQQVGATAIPVFSHHEVEAAPILLAAVGHLRYQVVDGTSCGGHNRGQ